MFHIFQRSVHSGMCSTACWIAHCVWQKLTVFLSISSKDKQRRAWFKVPWLAFQTSLNSGVQQLPCFVVRTYDSRNRICQHRFSPKLYSSLNIPQSELWRVFQKFSRVPSYVQARSWPFLTMVVTRINTRNVFYYKTSKNIFYIHCSVHHCNSLK